MGRVLTGLLGKDNVTAPTMAALGSDDRFVLSSLINKRLALVTDARLPPGRGGSRAVERLLSISGEDPQTTDRKYKSVWTGRVPTRFVILTNELPRFSDVSGALASRFISLQLQISFFGREDRGLENKLRAELPGILNWALDGLMRLRERGRFEPPQSSLDTFQHMEDLSSPVGAFVREKCNCEVGAGARIEKADLYGAYKRYCEVQGDKHPCTQVVFGRNLMAVYPTVRIGHSGATKYYYGIELRKSEVEDETEDDDYFLNRSSRTRQRQWTPEGEEDESGGEVTD
jgi:putative DNA primase/helicase